MDDDRREPTEPASVDAERVGATLRTLDVPAPPRLRRTVEAAVAEAQASAPAARRADDAPPARSRWGPDDAPPARSRWGPDDAPPARGRWRAGDTPFARSRWRTGRRPLAAAGLVAAAALVALVLALALPAGDDGAPPTVPEAARVALAQPTEAAPQPRPGGRLSAEIDGIAFPDWSRTAPYRWRADGQRSDELAGRALRTVSYASPGGERIGYAIAAGDALPWGGGEVVERDGVKLWVYEIEGATVVAWLRDGRTCILAGRGVERDELERLASSHA